MRILCILPVLFCFMLHPLMAQQDSANHLNRRIVLLSGSALSTAGSLVALNQAWYKQYSTGKFHFFDDNREWLQMDKAGHVYSTYQVSRLMMQTFQWAGFKKRDKLLIAGGSGFAYMTAIEVMDGFSRGWGFSWGDQICDVLGSGLAVVQEAVWQKQKIQLKFSYAESGLARYNPSLLGDSPTSRLLKDYNGQTYWLCVSPGSFFKKANAFPAWLNIAAGYSAFGMLGGHYNNVLAQDPDGSVYSYERTRLFLLSLDVDLTQVRTRHKWLRGLFSVVNMLKIPAPALQFSKNGIHAYGIYF